MVDEIMMQTINKMRASGIDDSEIKNMLETMGFSSSDVDSAFANTVKASNPIDEEEKTESVDEFDTDDENVLSNVKDHADRAELASNLSMSVSDAAVKKVEAHTATVESIKDDVQILKSSFDNLPQTTHIDSLHEKTDSLHSRTDELETKIDDINAKINVLTDIMKKILDNQRDILMRLK